MKLFRRDPAKRLQKAYEEKMKAAMLAMQNGDVRLNAQLYTEAEEIKAQLDAAANRSI